MSRFITVKELQTLMLDLVSDMSLSREEENQQNLALLVSPSPLTRLVTLKVT